MNRYVILIRGLAAASRHKRAALRAYHAASIRCLPLTAAYAKEAAEDYGIRYQMLRSALSDHFRMSFHCTGHVPLSVRI